MNPKKELLCGLWVNPASEATSNTAEVATHFSSASVQLLDADLIHAQGFRAWGP